MKIIGQNMAIKDSKNKTETEEHYYKYCYGKWIKVGTISKPSKD